MSTYSVPETAGLKSDWPWSNQSALHPSQTATVLKRPSSQQYLLPKAHLLSHGIRRRMLFFWNSNECLDTRDEQARFVSLGPIGLEADLLSHGIRRRVLSFWNSSACLDTRDKQARLASLGPIEPQAHLLSHGIRQWHRKVLRPVPGKATARDYSHLTVPLQPHISSVRSN